MNNPESSPPKSVANPAATAETSQQVALLTLLSAPGVGNNRALELVRIFGSAEKVLAAPAREIAEAAHVKLEVGRAVVKAGRDRSAAEKVIAKIRSLGGWVMTFSDAKYPVRLSRIPDPPAVLFVLGDWSPLFDFAVAIVGTRVPTEQGRKMALRLSGQLAAQGVTVVSGMALGIDSLAHTGALDAGGKTIAVLGSGLDVIYPPTNRKLYERIAGQGAVLSEFSPGTGPEPFNFPRRNRIISGLSLGTIIVEAGIKSGALITARYAVEQGRELFAVPGAAGQSRSAGVNRLIKDGAAHLIESAPEVIDHLKSQLAPVLNVAATLAVPDLKGNEATVYRLLEPGAMSVDELIRQSGLGAVELNRLLTTMQLKGIIRRHPGARVGRA